MVEWFAISMLSYGYYNCIAWITIQQGFSGLTTAYLITFAEYFTFYHYGMACWRCYKKTGQHNKKKF
jgi:hypothetical protein